MGNHQNPPAMDASAVNNQPPQKEEEKAVEVEKILVAKLEASITESSTPWSSKFNELLRLLGDKLKEEPQPDRKFRIRFRRKVRRLNDLMAEYDSIIHIANVRFVYRLGQIKKEIGSVLNVEGANTARPSIESQTERVPSSPSPIVSYGLDVDQMAVENLLLCRESSPEFNAVGIYGAEGVGKTTLALVIFHSNKVKSSYLPRIWICLTDRRESETKKSETEKIDKILRFVAKRILLHLGIDLETIEEMKTAGERFLVEAKRAIHTELRRKRYLVVLDGVSEEMKPAQMKCVMEMLRNTLPKGTRGAVVVTGRAETMVKAMVGDAKGIYQLQPLDKQWECWNVFTAATEKTDGGINDKDEKQKVKNEVVKRSHGLPWSSKLLGIIKREIDKPNPQRRRSSNNNNNTGDRQI